MPQPDSQILIISLFTNSLSLLRLGTHDSNTAPGAGLHYLLLTDSQAILAMLGTWNIHMSDFKWYLDDPRASMTFRYRSSRPRALVYTWDQTR